MVHPMRGDRQWLPTWDLFVDMWIEVLRGWEELEQCTLPQAETSLLIEALSSMQQTLVLRHPRVVVSASRTPPLPPPPMPIPLEPTHLCLDHLLHFPVNPLYTSSESVTTRRGRPGHL